MITANGHNPRRVGRGRPYGHGRSRTPVVANETFVPGLMVLAPGEDRSCPGGLAVAHYHDMTVGVDLPR